MRQFRVLIVDDDERIVNFLSVKLNACGYKVLTASNGVEALEQAEAQEPDMIVLDLLMPKMDGFETLRELRSFTTVPVIILSAKGADTDKIKGLGQGADDYVQKPFNPSELVARIEAIRRRMEPAERHGSLESLSIGELTIDFGARRVTYDGKDEHLTRIEWLLLSDLARNMGRLITYDELLTRVWGPEYRDDVQTLRTWISRLRYKIEKNPDGLKLIRTMPKIGYIMELPHS